MFLQHSGPCRPGRFVSPYCGAQATELAPTPPGQTGPKREKPCSETRGTTHPELRPITPIPNQWNGAPSPSRRPPHHWESATGWSTKMVKRGDIQAPPNRQEDPGTHQRPGPVRERKPVPEQPITDTRPTNYQATKHCADNPRSKHGIVPARHHLPNQPATTVDLRRHGAQALPPLGEGTRHVPR